MPDIPPFERLPNTGPDAFSDPQAFDRPNGPGLPIDLHAKDMRLEIHGNGTWVLYWKDVLGIGGSSPIENWVVRYVPLTFAGSPTGDSAWVNKLLAKSSYLGQEPSFGRGEELSHTHSDAFLQDGYIMLVGMRRLANSVLGIPSTPMLFINPAGGGGDAPIAPDSIDTVSLSTEMLYQGRSDFVKITAAYRGPADVTHFGGVQLYMQGYFGNPDLVEVGSMIRYTSESGHAMASGEIVLERDRDASSGTASATNGSPTLGLVGGSSYNTSGAWNGYRVYVNGVAYTISTVPNSSTITLTGNYAGTTGTKPIRVRFPVTFYFVPVSKSGTRTNDPRSAPSIVMPGGVDGNFDSVPSILNLTATQVGSTVILTMDDPGVATDADIIVDSVVIYRAFAGTLLSPVSPSQPAEKFAVITREANGTMAGALTWEDRNFDFGDATDRGDFEPGDPGRYRYWAAARNMRGEEDHNPPDVYVILQGDPGNTADPGVPSRGSGFNKLWNAEMIATVAGTYVGSGDTQKAAPPAGYNGWEALFSIAGEEPEWYANGTAVGAGAPAGEVRFSRGLPLAATDPSVFIQRVPKGKFEVGGHVVVSCEMKAGGPLNAQDYMAIGRVGLNGSTIVGGFSEGLFFSTVLTSDYMRFWVYVTLPDPGGAFDHWGFYVVRNAVGSSPGSSDYIYMHKPMVNDGTELAAWTSKMDDNEAPGGGVPTAPPSTPAGGGPNYCLFGGTPVLTPSGYKRVEDLSPGDEVLSLSPAGLVPAKVHRVTPSTSLNFVIIGQPPNQFICTVSHRVGYRRAGGPLKWKEAARLCPGDILQICRGGDKLVETPTWNQQGFISERWWDVFDLSIEGPYHNYFANGVLVHNKPIKP